MYPSTQFTLIPILIFASSQLAIAEVYESFTEPIRTHEVACIETGRIAEVFVKRGDRVEPGTSLVRLDASLLSASKKLAEAKAKPGAKLKAAEVELAAKTHRLKQLGQLLNEGVGNEEEVRRAIVDTDVARLSVEAAKEQIELAKLQLNEIQARIEQRLTRSPTSGLITDVYYEVGEYVSAQSMQCVKLVDIRKILVTFHLPTSVAISLSEGDSIEVCLSDREEKKPASIIYLGRTTEADSGRVRVDVAIDNPQEDVRSGIRCSFDTDTIEK